MANIIIKIIVINTVLFLFSRIGAWIIKNNIFDFMEWFILDTGLDKLLIKPWTFITYGFLHFDFFHIAWNMLFLYWFGNYVLNLFTEKRFLTIYLLGIICGGVLCVLSYNLFPVFEGKNAFLIGASAGVTAIAIFIATYTPYVELKLFVLRFRLWHVALIMVLKDLVELTTSDNSGGLLAHLGGAIFGYLYAIQLKKGNDLGKGFEGLMDTVVSWFSPRKKSPLKTVHRSKKPKTSQPKSSAKAKNPNQAQIDAILDKISKSGYDSLTKEEKDFLFKAGKE